MRYVVGIAIDGRYYARVDAENPDEAKKKAIEAYMDADFGELECIDCIPVNAEDENGNWTDF